MLRPTDRTVPMCATPAADLRDRFIVAELVVFSLSLTFCVYVLSHC